jgi:hypothetical protein
MTKYLLPFTCVLAILFCCENKEASTSTGCGTTNPAQDLAWLKAEIDLMENSNTEVSQYFYIRQGTYKGSTVFATINCCPVCNTLPPEVKNCDGVTLFNFSDARAKDVVFSDVVWKGKNFSCSL